MNARTRNLLTSLLAIGIVVAFQETGQAGAPPFRGIAVGNSSYAAYSYDGVTWTPPVSGSIFLPTRQINGVIVVDNNNAWAVGNTEGSQGLILKTSNASSPDPTWTRQTTGVPNHDLQDVTFRNLNNGWAVGGSGRILRTVDGGANWTAQQQGSNQLNAVYFHSDSLGWAVGNNERIYRSVDGGTNWIDDPLPTTMNIFDVTFKSDTVGWIVGSAGRIYKSTDGGDSWAPQTSPITNNLNSVHFLDDQIGWIGGNTGKVLQTTDGGTNWAEIADVGGDDVSAIYFATANVGWLSSGRRIYDTTDGGVNWTERFFGDHTLNDLSFLGAVPIPEPALGLAVLMLAGFTLRRRRFA
jgi:photosystem II stability/assembly factor-like uncharacterized protein